MLFRKEKIYYEVLTKERHEYFESDYNAFNLFRLTVEENQDCAVNEIKIIKRLFRKPLTIKECILDFERVEI